MCDWTHPDGGHGLSDGRQWRARVVHDFWCSVADVLDNCTFQGDFMELPVALSDNAENPSMVTFYAMTRSRLRVPFVLRIGSGCNLASVTQKWRPTSSVAALLGLGAFRGHNLCLTY